MDHQARWLPSWMFAWGGIPLAFGVVAHLVYLAVSYEPPSGHRADWICVGVMLGFLVVGMFVVRERLRPRAAWVVPVYASVMLGLLLMVLGLISLLFTGDL